MTTEIWKPIPDFPLYEASDQGRIRRGAPGINTHVGKVLRTSGSPRHSYLTVGLMRDGKAHTTLVHRAVYSAFHGACPDGYHVSHQNGQAHDNRSENLASEPAAENNQRKVGHGTQTRGEQHHRARLSQTAAASIRQRALSGEQHRPLAKEFGCGKSTVARIASGQTWKHLEGAA